MYKYLKTQFSAEENAVLHNFCDKFNTEVAIVYGVNTSQFDTAGVMPNRMLNVGGYYLLEVEGSEGAWELGLYSNDQYHFFSLCGSLEDALRDL